MKENQHKKSSQKRYDAEFKRSAVEMVIHGGKPLTQVARELGVSEYSLHLWKKAQLKRMSPAEVDGQEMSPQEMAKEIRRQQKEIEWLRQQREICREDVGKIDEPKAQALFETTAEVLGGLITAFEHYEQGAESGMRR